MPPLTEISQLSCVECPKKRFAFTATDVQAVNKFQCAEWTEANGPCAAVHTRFRYRPTEKATVRCLPDIQDAGIGDHIFAVRAVGNAGNRDATPANTVEVIGPLSEM